MAPSRFSLRPSRPPRSLSLEPERPRDTPDARWGDRSITAPTIQRPVGEPLPSEWASPATTLVDSSPDLSFDKALSPVNAHPRDDRVTLTLSIPLPWKRRRARSASPAASTALPTTRVVHDLFGSSNDDLPIVVAGPGTRQQTVESNDHVDAVAKHEQGLLSPRKIVDLKSPTFPHKPVPGYAYRTSRNMELLASELNAMVLERQVQSRKDRDISPIDNSSPWPLTPYHPRFLTSKQQHPVPISVEEPQGRLLNNLNTTNVHLRPPQQFSGDLLSPVQEGFERNGQLSSNSTSIEASPTSPVLASTHRDSLSTLAPSSVKSAVESQGESRPSRNVYATSVSAALHSHPTSAAPRSRSGSRHRTRRPPSRDGANSRQSTRQSPSRASSRDVDRVHESSSGRRYKSDNKAAAQASTLGDRRRSSTRRAPAMVTNTHHNHAYRRSSDLTKSRLDPISTGNPRKDIYAAYFNRRSRSAEPIPSPRLVLDHMQSPTDSLSSGSTDVDPASDQDSIVCFREPDHYYETRQMWNGFAGEGRKGFYANVADDYRLLRKDVDTANSTDVKRASMSGRSDTSLTRALSPVENTGVRIAGLDPMVMTGGQQLVPSSVELWG